MGKGSNTTTSQSTTAPSAQGQTIYNQILSQASNAASTPYQSYTGELVAPVNAQQTAGINNVNQNAGFATPYIQSAAALGAGAAGPLTQGQIQNYMSPYIGDVVNATQSYFNNQNAQQQAGLTGNTIAQNALGGNRQGVAQGVLAGQQQVSQAPVIAGLLNSGYQNAIQTAAQQYQGNPETVANLLANWGITGQGAALQGAQAQIGAGNLQQQTQQQADTAAYQQFLQQQAYPFQTSQYFANIAAPIGAAEGTVSSGQTTAPAPSLLGQIAGLGATGAGIIGATGGFGSSGWLTGLLSDERVKENIEPVGKTHDGQTIYKYNYKGDHITHMGLLAQEVEKHHPEAVHEIGGLKTVDYDKAVQRGLGGPVYRDGGGSVSGFPYSMPSTPYSGVGGYVPQTQSLGVHMAPAAGFPQAQNPGAQNSANNQTAQQALGFLDKYNQSNNNGFTLPGGDPTSNAINDYLQDQEIAGEGGAPLSSYLAKGGFVRGYADGGDPTDDERAYGLDLLRQGMGGASPLDNSDWPSGPVNGPSDVINPGDPIRMPSPDAVKQMWDTTQTVDSQGNVHPPASVPDDDEETPSAPTATAGLAGPYVAPVAPLSRDDAQAGFGSNATINGESGAGESKPSPVWQALMAAGLGMLSSRSPFPGVAIGEGGLAGLNAYSSAQAAELKARQDQIKQEQENRRIDMEAQRLHQEAQRAADDFALRAQGQTETARHNKATEEKEYKPTWSPISEGIDPQTGLSRKVYGWVDPNKKVVTDASGKPIDQSTSPTPPPNPSIGSDGKPLAGSDFLSSVSPDRAARAKMIGDYEESPQDLPTRGGIRAAAVADAKRYNKDYNEQNYAASQRAYNNFQGGPESRTVRSLNVATDHLDTLRQAASALQNGNYPLLNTLVNKYREETGSPLTTNFDSIKQAVSSEIAKVVVGGQTALQDRDEMSNRARNSDSPDQLNGIFDGFTKLMGGQMKGLKQQYEGTTYRKDFDKYLLPATKSALARVSGDTPATWEKSTPTDADRAYVKAHPEVRDKFIQRFGVEP